MRNRSLYIFFVLAILSLTAPRARAQSTSSNNTVSQAALRGSRILRTFDFEETRLGNFEATPMFWSKVVGRGFPAYSTGTFDHTNFRTSNTSFMLNTDGGSVAYRFTPPPEKRIAIQPNSDYYILAFIRTSQLKHARAQLTAWFADDQGNIDAATEAHSQAYSPTAANGITDDAWQVLYVYMPGPPPSTENKTHSLVLQMGLMQPQQLDGSDKLGKFAIYQQDIKGSAWFDDITVFQLPCVGVTAHKAGKSNTPAGMFAAGESIDLDIQLADLGAPTSTTPPTAPPSARLRVTNADGLLFATQQWQLPASNNEGSSWSKQFTHAALPAGQYIATLDVLDSQNTLLARRQTQFLCLPEISQNAPPASEFGLGAASWTNPEAWSELPQLLRQTGAGAIQLPVWRRDMTEDALTRRDAPLDALLATLQRQNIRIVGTFSELPDLISSHISTSSDRMMDKSSIFALLDADPQTWRSYMSFPLTRYANRVELWEFGSPAAPFSGIPTSDASIGAPSALHDRASKLYSATYSEFASLMSHANLVIPWNALFDIDPAQFPHATLDLRLPAVIKPSQLTAYLENFHQMPAGPATAVTPKKNSPLIAHIEGLSPRDTPRNDRLADFAQRIVYVHTANPDTILYDVSPNNPDELLLVYATMARALGNSIYLGELPLAQGVHAFLFKKLGNPRPGGNAVMVLWTDGGETSLAMPLGNDPRSIDLLGNRRPLTTDPATHLTKVSISQMPILIQQFEPEVLQLSSTFSLATSTIPAGIGSLETDVLLHNPYTDSLSGSLRLLPPKGWTVDPPSVPVAIASNGDLRESVTLHYPFSDPAGRKTMQGKLMLDAGNPTGLRELTFDTPMTVTSDLLEMEGFVHVEPTGEILIQQVITNMASTPLDGEAYALVPGFPRQQRYIVGLAPHTSTIKRFTFAPSAYVSTDASNPVAKKINPEDIARALLGQSATLGVRQSDGRTLLTKTIPLE